ncbi:MAG: hypothetical protein J7K49_04945 [Thaumarchaeota archaeon]|nr:hypothetical protein [Nitrososphaerota archaeon]
MSERKMFLRGSFEDVCEAQRELLRKIGDVAVKWDEIEELIIRAFCGFQPPELKVILGLIRRYGLTEDEAARRFLKMEIPCHFDYALREAFRLSGEQPVRRGVLRE